MSEPASSTRTRCRAARRQLPSAHRKLQAAGRRSWEPKSSRAWCDYFRQNAASLLRIPWGMGAQLTQAERSAIAKSLQAFQLGESGEGRHLIRVATEYAARTGDEEYVTALRLFIAEEQRHAAGWPGQITGWPGRVASLKRSGPSR